MQISNPGLFSLKNVMKNNTLNNATNPNNISFKGSLDHNKDTIIFTSRVKQNPDAKIYTFPKKCIDDKSLGALKGKVVLVRADLNDSGLPRLRALLPDLNYLQKNGAKIVLCSHYGRPEGRDPKYKLDAVAEGLTKLGIKNLTKMDDCIGPDVEKAVSNMNNGDIVLLENLRFHKGEKDPGADPDYVQGLLNLKPSIYVNAAFGTVHNKDDFSTTGLPAELKKSGIPVVAGLLLKKEDVAIQNFMNNKTGKGLAIIAGSKLADKTKTVFNLLDKLKEGDTLALAGAMPFAFVLAQHPDAEFGKSYVVTTDKKENDMIDKAREIIDTAKKRGIKLIIPTDVVVNHEGDSYPIDKIPADQAGLDIGPNSIKQIQDAIGESNFVLMNGPAGKYEDGYKKATIDILNSIADATQRKAKCVIGGGNTGEVIDELVAQKEIPSLKKLGHVSTGGGALVSYLEGKEHKSIDVLDDK